MNLIPRPHDLLVLADGADVQAEVAAEQEALNAALRQARTVVVRRGVARGPLLAVGVRGRLREERFAGWLKREDACEVIAPESLRIQHGESSLAALQALWALQGRWAWCGLSWGPVGSVGFALASGVDVVTETSDLDVVVFAPEPLDAEVLRRLQDGCEGLPCRVDVQVVTPLGGVALGELVVGPRRVLLRAVDGVRMVDDPWLEAVAL